MVHSRFRPEVPPAPAAARGAARRDGRHLRSDPLPPLRQDRKG
ncbi:hypothetical protein ACF1CG_12870 [Streptomyces sp. NPDC014773]